jgi:hypothetical protein
MSGENGKGLQTILWAVGVFLIAAVVGGVAAVGHPKSGAWTDLLPQGWLSEDDAKALKDPEGSNKAASERMAKEAWENSQARQGQGWQSGQQPQGWQGGWHK